MLQRNWIADGAPATATTWIAWTARNPLERPAGQQRGEGSAKPDRHGTNSNEEPRRFGGRSAPERRSAGGRPRHARRTGLRAEHAVEHPAAEAADDGQHQDRRGRRQLLAPVEARERARVRDARRGQLGRVVLLVALVDAIGAARAA